MVTAPAPKPAEILKGVLYQGGTMMFSGPSKARKTYTKLDLALSVSTGTPFLGFETTKAPVIYLNFELCDYSIDQRVAAICKAKGIKPPETFIQYNLRGKGVTLAALEAELPQRIREYGAGLAIVDPWYTVAASSGADENSNDGQARILAGLQQIVTGSGAALSLGHHFAKGDASAKNSIDRGAGAGAMARWGDAIVTLTEHEEPDAMTLEFHLRDFAPVEKFAVRWNLPLWERDSSLDPARLKKKGGRIDQHPASEARKALRGRMTIAEWREALGWPDTTLRTKAKELVKAGEVICECGTYRLADA